MSEGTTLVCIAADASAAAAAGRQVQALAAPSMPRPQVVIERRRADRRRRVERRMATHAAPDPERRLIRAPAGRRAGEHRAPAGIAAEPAPSELRQLANVPGIQIVERVAHSHVRHRDLHGTRLAIRFQAGDRDAFTEIYALYFPPVRNRIHRLLQDHDEAEDLAQQVFIKALKALPRYEARGPSFGKWLITIARNTALDELRVKGKAFAVDPHIVGRLIEERHDREDDQPDPGGDYDVGPLLDALPDDQRLILRLRYEFGFEPQEIADLLGRSPAGISAARHRALVALETALAGAQHPAAQGRRVRRSNKVRALPALA